jgi:GAF domain-containing protein
MAKLDAPERLSRFRGELVSLNPDDVLDDCVRAAGRLAETPIALVSFVMGHVQYFRSAVGLPPEIDLSRATARCHSYCQHVVTSEQPLAIEDIRARGDLPQMLARVYGVRAYLGVPVRSDGQVLGTLCVVDVKPRKWSYAAVTELSELAARVSRRLDQLATQGQGDAEAAPSSELHLLARSVSEGARVIERALAEVGPMVRLAGGLGLDELPSDAFVRGATALREATELYRDLVDAARSVSWLGEQLTAAVQPVTTTAVN